MISGVATMGLSSASLIHVPLDEYFSLLTVFLLCSASQYRHERSAVHQPAPVTRMVAAIDTMVSVGSHAIGMSASYASIAMKWVAQIPVPETKVANASHAWRWPTPLRACSRI